jgi:N6-adenosine-specific RNA methylase IME4
VLADPPWSFRDKGSRIAPERAPGGRYATMSVLQIAMLPVEQLAAPDSLLFLWTTSAHLLDGSAADVCDAWGFEAKATIAWVKCRLPAAGKLGVPVLPRLQIGMGHYVRNAHEHLVIARRGRARVKRRDVPSVIFAPRGRHSAKPAESYDRIERLCDGPRLELFARGLPRPGWIGWGDQFGLEAA